MRQKPIIREKATDQQPIGEYMRVVGFGNLHDNKYYYCLRFKNGIEDKSTEYLINERRAYIHSCISIQVSQERFDAIMNTKDTVKNHLTKLWESLIDNPVDVIRFSVTNDKSQYVYVTYERARREIKQERWFDDDGKEHITSGKVFVRIYGLRKLNEQ